MNQDVARNIFSQLQHRLNRGQKFPSAGLGFQSTRPLSRAIAQATPRDFRSSPVHLVYETSQQRKQTQYTDPRRVAHLRRKTHENDNRNLFARKGKETNGPRAFSRSFAEKCFFEAAKSVHAVDASVNFNDCLDGHFDNRGILSAKMKSRSHFVRQTKFASKSSQKRREAEITGKLWRKFACVATWKPLSSIVRDFLFALIENPGFLCFLTTPRNRFDSIYSRNTVG